MIWALLISIIMPILAMGACRLSLERLWPVHRARKSVSLNICAFLVWFAAQTAVSPGVKSFGTLLANRLGGGFISLPSHGWGLAGGFLVYLLVADLAEYLFHRAEHVFPWLWSMHSLHHSDPEFDSSTAVLHYWMVPAIHAIAVSVPLGLIFNIPTTYLLLYSISSYHVYIMHANLRLDFGRWSWLITSPIYHRLHHSAEPGHFNCNYAFIFPVFDVLFRSYRPARPGEWPPVGLGPGREPRSVLDLLWWPLRDPIGRPLANTHAKGLDGPMKWAFTADKRRA